MTVAGISHGTLFTKCWLQVAGTARLLLLYLSGFLAYNFPGRGSQETAIITKNLHIAVVHVSDLIGTEIHGQEQRELC